MLINRTLLLREPGHVLWDSSRFYFQGDLTLKPVVTSQDIQSMVHGTIDSRVTNRMFTISGTLAGAWKDYSKLYGLMSLARGASVFTGSDKPLVIHTVSGRKITFHCAAITTPPPIIGRAGATMLGNVEFTAILKNSSDPATESSYYTFATEAYPGDATFDPDEILTLPLTAAWGVSTPWDSFLSRGGWTITPTVALSAEDVDGLGTVDMKIQDITVTAVATPAGITQAQLLPKLSHGTGLGARRAGDDLVLTADGVWIKLTDCILTDGNSAHGDAPVVGDCTWTARRTWSTGTLQPLLAVGAAEPE